jgi:predicted permease
VRSGHALTDFVFKVAIPILLFLTLARADFQGLSPWRIWAAYFIPFGVIWALAHVAIRHVFGRDARAGAVAGASAAFSNSVLIGIPLMQAAFGEAGTIYLIVIVSVHLPIMMLLGVALNELAETNAADPGRAAEPKGHVLRRLMITLATHPILLSIMAGALWRVAGVPIPGLVSAILDPLGRAAGRLPSLQRAWDSATTALRARSGRPSRYRP